MTLKVFTHGADVKVPFNQAEDFMYMSLDSASRDGVCAAISAHWIRMHSQGQDFWKWIKSVKGIATVVNTQATKEQGVFRGSFAFPGAATKPVTGGPDDWIVDLLTEVPMSVKTPSRTTRFGLQLSTWILNDLGAYKFISLYGDAGGHAVAAHVGERVTFMDPNVGEVSFPARGNFQVWLPKFLSSYQFRDTPTSPIKTFSNFATLGFGK